MVVERNPFATRAGARRYHEGRPFHHPRAVRRIMEALGHPVLSSALDVACGTGLSTVALAEYAGFAIGIDPVAEMLRLAPARQNVAYACAAAELIPVAERGVDLVTVSSGIHWFDQPRFFGEARRVLRPGGWLAIYDHFFRGSEDRGLDEWLRTEYAARYPAPPRGPQAHSVTGAPPGFAAVEDLEYDDPIDFTHDELVAYLLSQSNTIATRRRETPSQTASWLLQGTARWFEGKTQPGFVFRGVVRCLRSDPLLGEGRGPLRQGSGRNSEAPGESSTCEDRHP